MRVVSESEAARRALSTSEARLRLALTGARAGAWEWDMRTGEVVWSPELYTLLGVDPTRCAVVEDTVTGVRAGVAAGATVFGYSPAEAGHDAPAALRSAGASVIFTDMAQLPQLLG